MNKYKSYIIFILLIAVIAFDAEAQDIENTSQTRTEFKLSYKLADKWKLQAIPELRFDEAFSIDKCILELRTVYNPFKRLSLGASYRFIANERSTKDTEYLQRYAFDMRYEYKLKRWKPAVRLRYTNYSEDDENGEFLRAKAGLEYNIRKCKFTPFAGAELFRDMNNNELFKVRYSLGTDYKINKTNSISMGYKLDYYMQRYENKHIMYLGYKFKF
ncbi:DUF2490 domain-containing protein [Carboxylicivirga sp. RSCT41]|uniref:DUF2490 domain-containing protein n=1 Tax=Carboxylicivirga agarovorans TaxID=3417570 RepID=UPI003D351593